MADDESHIRTLIENWARAVHQGDMEGVLADHTDDIVMFDVPPPSDGVRGIDAYRETWPPFFTMAKAGRLFRDRLARHHRGRRCRVRVRVAALRNSRGTE
jgi:ketosteroid isomerase-like protein